MCINKLKNFLFPDYPKLLQNNVKTLKDLDIMDTVWIKDKSGNILEGWVFDINKKHIIVTVYIGCGEFLDFRFSVTRPISQTQLVQDNKVLFLSRPNINYE